MSLNSLYKKVTYKGLTLRKKMLLYNILLVLTKSGKKFSASYRNEKCKKTHRLNFLRQKIFSL